MGVEEVHVMNKKSILLPKSDFVFKRIFGDHINADILRNFLQAVLNCRPVNMTT